MPIFMCVYILIDSLLESLEQIVAKRAMIGTCRLMQKRCFVSVFVTYRNRLNGSSCDDKFES